MASEMEKMASRIASLERRLAQVAGDEENKDEEVKEEKTASQRDLLASEIQALEEKLDEEDKDEGKTASLVDPKGVEEDITQKYLTEVEKLEHGTELATDASMLKAAPTGYVARMKSASARLDAVANYLEKTGRKAMALRIDKIADQIDSRIAGFTTNS